ncbi:hypothetical protein A0H81_03707 [Grifola frondosa]|uniref:Uncharacterized protein n=1 Tax=Grifola frondosa TaxID=5627 RepID=A0A1C7MNN5_GRIFR|nr:hypothetical protein A0H81_03707 [Grifola frondosa]
MDEELDVEAFEKGFGSDEDGYEDEDEHEHEYEYKYEREREREEEDESSCLNITPLELYGEWVLSDERDGTSHHMWKCSLCDDKQPQPPSVAMCTQHENSMKHRDLLEQKALCMLHSDTTSPLNAVNARFSQDLVQSATRSLLTFLTSHISSEHAAVCSLSSLPQLNWGLFEASEDSSLTPSQKEHAVKLIALTLLDRFDEEFIESENDDGE